MRARIKVGEKHRVGRSPRHQRDDPAPMARKIPGFSRALDRRRAAADELRRGRRMDEVAARQAAEERIWKLEAEDWEGVVTETIASVPTRAVGAIKPST